MPRTALQVTGVTGRRYGLFSGRLVGGPHPVGEITALHATGLPGRKFPSFAGKSQLPTATSTFAEILRISEVILYTGSVDIGSSSIFIGAAEAIIPAAVVVQRDIAEAFGILESANSLKANFVSMVESIGMLDSVTTTAATVVSGRCAENLALLDAVSTVKRTSSTFAETLGPREIMLSLAIAVPGVASKTHRWIVPPKRRRWIVE